MSVFEEILNNIPSYKEIVKSISNNSVVVNGLADVQKRHFACGVAKKQNRPFVFIAQNEADIDNIINDIEFFSEKEIDYLPEENARLQVGTKSKDIYIKRAKIFEKLLLGEKPNLVVTSGIVLNLFTKLDTFKKNKIKIETGKIYSIETISEILVKCGYERTEIVEGVGQFSVRGGILDVYSPTAQNPYRVEFFDDEVDSIRIFDSITQRTIEKVEEIDIFPVSSEDSVESEVPFLEYLPEEYMIFIEEPQRLMDKIDTMIFEYQELIDKIETKEELPKRVFSREEIFNCLFDRKAVFLSTLETRLKEFSRVEKFSLLSREITGFGNSFDNLAKTISEWKNQGYRVIVLAGTETKGKNVCKKCISEMEIIK